MARKSTHIRATSRQLALEPRLLFDGAAAIAVDQSVHDTQDDGTLHDIHQADAEPALDSSGVSGSAPALVFIDSRATDAVQLADALQSSGAEVHLVEPDASGLQAVSNALAQAGNVGSLQIIGLHTDSSEVQLGSDSLSGNGVELAAEQGWNYYLVQDVSVDVQETHQAEQSQFRPAAFSRMMLAAEVPAVGSISDVKNTSDDGTAAVGENDPATPVTNDWEVTGSGSITVTVTGGAKGQLSHAGGSLTFTGTASEVNTFLDGVRYVYKGNSQVGDIDTLTLSFTAYAQDGSIGSSSTKTQVISIAPQNDAPTVGKNGQIIAQVNEGGVFNFGAAVTSGSGFTHAITGIADVDNIADQAIIKLESIPDPLHGSLVLNNGGQSVTLAVGSTLSVADLKNLSYVHTGKQVSPANGQPATPLQNITFTIDDGAGGRLTSQTISIKLMPVNQLPSVSGSVTIIEGEKNVSLGYGGNLPVIGGVRGQIVGADPDDSQLSYTIAVLPTTGTLSYNGVLLTSANKAATVITDLKLLTYSYPDGSEPKDHLGAVHFTITVKDSGGGTATPLQSDNVITLTVLDNNDDPILVNNQIQDYGQLKTDGKVSNNSFTLTTDMLSVTDPDSFDNNLVFNIKQAATEGGYFTLNGKLLDANTSFTMQDVKDGKVAYHLRTSSAQVRTDSFTFTVKDSATGLLFGNDPITQRDGGIYDSNLPNAALTEFTFKVTVPAAEPGSGGVLPPLPDPTTGLVIAGDKNFTLLEGAGTSGNSTGYTLTTADLSTSDGVSAADKITYRLEELPASGTLYLDGRALSQFGSFTQANIDAGLVVFKHAGGEQFTDQFRFSVSNGSTSTDALNTFSIRATPQNDTPTASQGETINVLEGASVVINNNGLGHIVLSDSDRVVAGEAGYANQNTLWLEVTSLPATGTLYLLDAGGGRTAVALHDRITQADLNTGKLIYQHNGNEVFADSFTIRPLDNQKVGTDIGDLTAPTATNQASVGADVVIKITVAPENDAPALASKNDLTNVHALPEGGTATIYGTTVPGGSQPPYGQLAYADPDNSAIQVQFRVTEATKYGQLLKNGVALKVGSAFTQADLDAGLITYKHNGGEGHTDSFKYLVSDGDYTVSDTGVNLTPSIFQIELKPSNDTPVFTGKPGAPILVDGVAANNNKAPGFVLSDPDLKSLDPGEVDKITVIVRVVDSSGKPVVWASTPGNITLQVDSVSGVIGGTSITNGYLLLTGSVADINSALATLSVGSSADLNAKYVLQVIADDRLNPAGTAYQNGGAGVIANGGALNHVSSGTTAVDANSYDWNAEQTSTLQGSLNLAIASTEIWISTINEPATLLLPADYVVAEDVPTRLDGIVLGDTESATFGTSVQITFSVGSGTLSALNLPSGITVSGGGTGSLTLTGSVTALNALLASNAAGQGVFYTSARDVNHDTNGAATGDVTLTVTLKEGASNIGEPAKGGSAIGGDVGAGSVENGSVVKTIGIIITAINDAPTITAPTGNVSVNSSGWTSVGTFGIVDLDAENGYSTGETDGSIAVTVRLLDNGGNPLTLSTYQTLGIDLGSTNSVAGVTVDSTLGGVSGALQLRGTLADVQTYLNGLQVRFNNAVNANVDATYRVEVIVDDRLRNPDGSLIAGQANGGVQNQNGINAPQAISTKDDFAVYTGKVADFKDGATQVYNVVSATRNIFVSSVNDPAQIGIGGVYQGDTSTLEAVETAGKGTVTLDGLTIADKDAQATDVLAVTITLPDGFTFASNGGKTLTLTGTLTAINSALNTTVVNLPDVTGDARAEDWNGSFTFNVSVNDRGNTGVTPNTAPAASNGNTYSIGSYSGQPSLVTERDITFVVRPTNDAPVAKPVGGSSNATMPSITEDTVQNAAPTGTTSTVNSLFSPYFDDSRDEIRSNQATGANAGTGSQADSFFGVAIVGNSATAAQGRWQYFNGTSWVNIPTDAADNRALILDKDVALQFIPAADWHGTPGQLSVRLVELNVNADTTSTSTAPVSKSTVDLTTSGGVGGSSLFSNEKVTLGITVTPVNDAPVATPDTHTMTENTASVSGGLITQPTGASPGVTGVDSDKDKALDASEAITVTAVRNSDNTAGSIVGGVISVAGKYGDLVVQPNGSYTYQLHRNDPAVNALVVGQNLTETFSYIITDTGSLTAASTLTITITGDNDGGATITPTDHNGPGIGGQITVNESGLVQGSNPGSDATAGGTLTFTAGNGLASVQIGTTSYTLAQLQAIDPLDSSTHLSVVLPHGTVVISGFNPTAGHAVPVSGSIDYSYTLTQQQSHPAANGNNATTADISLRITDAGGMTNTGTLTVQIIDDVPTATPDTGNVTEGATLTVAAASGVLANDKAGADGWKTGGGVTGAIAGSGTPVPAGVGAAITGQYGTLTLKADGSYSYVARPNSITSNVQDVFSYTVTDADGDTATTTLTINVDNVTGVPTTTGATVNESGLTAGSTPGTGHTAAGDLTLASGWSVATAQSGSTALGNWNVGTDGKFSYVLTSPTTDVAGVPETDTFTYTSVDQYGNTVSNTVVVAIVDDVPTATPDTNSVTEGATLTVNAASGVLANDKAGADGWQAGGGVTGVIAGSGTPVAGTAGSAVVGQYGTLTLKADGSYSYVARPDATTANVQDVFSYTVTDADGDTATTTLTINVANVTGVPISTTGATVNESGLAAGSNPGVGHTASGDLTLASGWSVGIGQSGSTALGNWSVSTDGKFSYVLTSPTTDVAGVPETDTFTYTSVDQYGNTVSNTVVVAIVDDVPTATPDTNSVTEGATLTVNAASGVLANDKAGADGWQASGGVTGVIAGSGTPVAGTAGNAVVGQYGTLTLNADGSYSYVARPDATTANVQDVFSYTVTDADGDTSTTTLTINVANVNGVPTSTTGATVNESGLTAGSNPGVGHTASGDLTLASGWSVGIGQSGSTALGNWSVGIDGKFSYVLTSPTTDVAGVPETDTFSYTSVDQHGNTVSNTVVVTIVDDVPTARDDHFTSAEDQILTGDLKLDHGNGKDLSSADGNKWTLIGGAHDGAGNTILTTAQGGSLTLRPDGTFDYIPIADWHGTDSFEYTVTDGDGDTSTATVTITVTPVVDITPDTATTHAGTPVSTPVLANDSFEGKSPVVSVEAGNGPAHGTVTVNPDGTITYTPQPGYVGNDSYTYTVSSGGVTESALVTIDVTNTPPVLKPEVVSTPEDTPVSGKLLDNDTDADGDNLSVTDITIDGTPHVIPPGTSVTVVIAGKGSITVGSDGAYQFTPEADWHGAVPVISYTVSDGNSNGSVSSTLTLNVTPVVDITPDTAITHAGTPVTTPVLVNDSFEGNTPVVSVEAGNGPAHGMVKVNPDGTITYTPQPGYVGNDSYTYTVSSGGVTESALVTIDVTNTPPVLKPEVVSTPEDTPVSGKLLDNDTDADGDSLTVIGITIDGTPHAIAPGTSVTVVIAGKGSITVGSDGTYQFTPEADWHGDVPVISYTVSDGNSNGSVTSTLTLNVTPVVDITPDTATTHAGKPVTTPVLANDSFEGKTPVVSVEAEAGHGPAHGTVTVNPDGSITYTPQSGYVGKDSYTYTVSSGGVTETAIVTIDVTNTPPVLKPEVVTTPEDTPVSGKLLDNDTDADGDSLTVTGITVDGTPHAIAPGTSVTVVIAGKGSITVGSDGTYQFTPEADWHGDVPVISYTVSDGNSNGSVSSTLTLNVTPVADITTDTATTLANTPVTTPVLVNDSFEGKSPVVSVDAGNGPAHGTVKVNPDGSITYTPQPGYVGSDSYTYTVSSGGVTESATVTVGVTNTAPVANDDRHVTEPGQPAIGNVLTGGSRGDAPDSDADGNTLTVTQISVNGTTHAITPGQRTTVTLPGKGTLVFGSDGSYTFTPEVFSGGEVPAIDYTISDGHGGTDTATLTIFTTPEPSAPQIVPPAQSIEVPTETQQSERPLFDQAGLAPWKGDVAHDPSVFWENHGHDRIMRLPLALHPIDYVNRQVQNEQVQRAMEAVLGTDPALQPGGEVRSRSIGSGLGQDQQLYVQHAVRGAQGEGQYWQLKAWRNVPNLPVQAPREAPALDMAEMPAGEEAAAVPAPQAGRADGMAMAQAELLQRWALQDASDASMADNGAAPAVVAADSFRAQVLARAAELPGGTY